MERYTFSMELKNGAYADYVKRLGMVFSELTAYLDCGQIQNFSIWNVENLIFGYCELPDGYERTKERKEQRRCMEEKMGDTFTWISDPEKTMRLMYQDFGIVRESKELIRHRVFVTKLKEHCEEEYKRRHDVLVQKRGTKVTQGPDSNFGIWSAGGYIFGYDEIDVTMEKEETPEEREATVLWETKQLEIMDWLTNDVDWMTKEVHSPIKRLACHLGKNIC